MSKRTVLIGLLSAVSCWAQLEDLPQIKDFNAYRSSSNNPDPNSNDDSKRPIPGETVVLADLRGPGTVTHIWLTVAANEYGWPKLLRFRVYYDGSTTPSVDAPLGDFFAVGHGMERPVTSQVVRNGSSGRSRNCYWPMPFRKSCKITVTNEGRRRVSNLYYHVDWRKQPALASNTAYFHSHYRQELPTEMGKHYTILDVKGRGHYVGTVLSVIQREAGWFGEGDDYFYVDGERKPRIEGTGTEDYFNDAWTLRVADGPYSGVSIADGTGIGSRMTAYRWHLPDPVPFTRSLKFDIEHAGWTYNADGSVRSGFEERADLFSSVAFWYQLGIAQGLPEPPYGTARLPHGNARQIEVEDLLPEIRTTGGTASVQREVFWSRDLLFFDAKGPGARIEIPFEIADTGRYELLSQIAHSTDYGNYRVLLDGKPISASGAMEHEPGANLGGEDLINAYYTEIYVAEDHVLGWPKLERGKHWIAFECVGKNSQSVGYRLGIDTLIVSRIAGDFVVTDVEKAVLARVQAVRGISALGATGITRIPELTKALESPDEIVRITATSVLSEFGAAASPAKSALVRALADESPVVRGLAAMSLRNIAPAALSVLPDLIGHLKDTDPNVRLMSAQAIGRNGAAAVAAVPELTAACSVKGEQIHVLRSLVNALGDIGPPAAPALPEILEMQKIPRVRTNAEAAIKKIEAK